MVKISLAFLMLMFYSCRQQEIKYSGFNDLVVGSQRVNLYDDHRFFLELSMGGTEGDYKQTGDTVILFYDSKPAADWPDSLLITKDYFELFTSKSYNKRTKIRRDK